MYTVYRLVKACKHTYKCAHTQSTELILLGMFYVAVATPVKCLIDPSIFLLPHKDLNN